MIMVMQPQSQYDFITNPGKPPKKPLLPSGNSMQTRIFIFLGGVVVLIILGVIVASLLSSGGNKQKETLTKAAQQQTELIRVSAIGIEKARDSSTRNLATTINLSLQSDQQKLLGHVKVSAKQLALGKNSQTDVSLTSAEQSNKFDEVFKQTMQTQLTAYQKSLKTAYDGSSSAKLKTSLSELFVNADTLIAQSKSTN